MNNYEKYEKYVYLLGIAFIVWLGYQYLSLNDRVRELQYQNEQLQSESEYYQERIIELEG